MLSKILPIIAQLCRLRQLDSAFGLYYDRENFAKGGMTMFLDTDFLQNDELKLKLKKTSDANPAKQWLPAYYFDICLLDGTEAGSIDLRIGHNERVYYGGNIGYEIKPEHRGHHYAGKAVKLLMELARKHGMDEVLITCDPSNPASARTCEYAGGVLETVADIPEDHDMYKEGKRQVCIYRLRI